MLKVSDPGNYNRIESKFFSQPLVYHEARYNTSLKNPCFKSTCSHLCLLVPGGRRCACPDNSIQPSHRSTAEVVCDAGEYLQESPN